MRTSRILVSILATTCLALTACGDDKKSDEPEEKESAAPAAEVSGDPDSWPLTGLPVDGGDDSIQNHPVLVLKLDNTGASAPQQGLGSADLVVEELVEGGSTRLAAFYYSDIPGDVGPVRSMRASDIGIVSPVHGTMVTSGAASQTISRLKDADVDFVAEGSKGFFRESSRSAPYNLFTNLKDVAKATKLEKPARPVDYLPFADADLPGGQPAKQLTAQFSGGHSTTWAFRDGHYVNENSYAADGDEFLADTVLVLRVKVGDAGYTDPAGNPVPETKLEGKGTVMLFHDGSLVRGTWTKKSLDAPLELSTKAGDLSVPPGHTWIELVPESEPGDVTFGK